MRDKSQKGYHRLIVWQKSQQLVYLIYKTTENFPKIEEFGLKSQIRRAVISIVLNIVEGSRRESVKEYLHFLNIALGSLTEVEACLELALGLNFLSKPEYEKAEGQVYEVGKLLSSFVKAIKAKN